MDMPNFSQFVTDVTQTWIERCIHDQRFIAECERRIGRQRKPHPEHDHEYNDAESTLLKETLETMFYSRERRL